jgi:hypothetical protein
MLTRYRSLVLEDITQRLSGSPDTGIMFAYSSYKDQNAIKGASRFLASFILQLSRQTNELSQALVDIHDENNNCGASNTSFTQIHKAFIATISGFRFLYVIFDGLDECEKNDREKLFTIFEQLIKNDGITNDTDGTVNYRVKIFVTSRREKHIHDAFKSLLKSSILEISATKVHKDIRSYVESQISHRIEQKQLHLSNNSSELQSKICDKLCDGGMLVFQSL